MGVATLMVKLETEIEVPAEALVRVLVIDDEQSVREGWQRLFEGLGFYVDAADSPDAAISLLRKGKYDMVVADILFENSPQTGDQLITENRNLMKEASVVAMTAYSKDRIKRIKQLEEMGVKVLEKGSGTDALETIVAEKLEERKRQMSSLAQQSLTSLVRESLANDALSNNGEQARAQSLHIAPSLSSQDLLFKIEHTLITWFKTRKNPDKKSIVFGGKTLSANELAVEVERGTEIGLEHVDAMITLFKDCLHLK